MAEFTRVSLRKSIEATEQALEGAQGALERLSAHGASSATTTLADVAASLQESLQSLRLVDSYIQQKAGLLPAQTSGESPAK